MHRYFPHTEEDVRQMLEVIGAKSLDDLYAEIPQELLLGRELDLPKGKSEVEIRRTMAALSAKNKQLVCFAGAGAYDHYTPSLVPYIASRSEFSTSYTPYQAEISQGTLMYIFEYQTMMAHLTGMDVSNASMYDGATATAEAMMMTAAAARKRNKVAISQTLPPRVLAVCRTYADYHGIALVEVPARDGVTDREQLSALIAGGDLAGVIVPQPNYFGIVEDLTGLADECHGQKTLLVVSGAASPLGVLKSPGAWGADIACGDAQSLGIPLGFGGPYIGYLCAKNALIRKMPGRIVGQTEDKDGKRTFVLTMQAREQHIRREKATSNICTAQGMMCLYVAAYLSLLGPQGLREVNENSCRGAHALADKLVASGKFELLYPGQPFLYEFAVRAKADTADALIERAAEAGYLAGVKLSDDTLLIAVTEQRSQEEIDRLVELLTA
ncbi:MAG: aminomethyl-transferring glycine dehydrogenase subunit GcvPA [Bacteroidaceae bacterium]|nr:aminomethyl-transferring glycine dehydrogenase subunit GcvPA [Bacteroidaceae bacterium]